MLSFKKFLKEQSLLYENLIVFRGKRSKFGRVIFLAGGAGSGKGFALKNFLDASTATDKIRDVDEWKSAFLKLDKLKQKFPEIRDLNLGNPKDVGTLHKFVSEKKIKSKTLDLLLKDLRSDRLPNIVFDVTLKDRSDIEKVIPALLEVGYDSKDIHLVWVLANYSISVKRNRKRKRVVPDDILLKTHEGAALTMHSILKGNLPEGLDGEIHVILNNPENTVYQTDGNDNIIKVTPKFGPNKGEKIAIVKDFLSLKVKDAGGKIDKENSVNKQIKGWMKDNIPKSTRISDLF